MTNIDLRVDCRTPEKLISYELSSTERDIVNVLLCVGLVNICPYLTVTHWADEQKRFTGTEAAHAQESRRAHQTYMY